MPDTLLKQLQSILGDAYAIERELTGGGMSRVFLATETALGRQVVIKVLPPGLAAEVSATRFRREIQLAAQLQHPHIVTVLTAAERGELLYYTMPYVAGESLRRALEAKGRIAVRDVVRMLHDVVDALAYAHDRGVVHRDIKPGNILMSGQHALVTDFGVAKALSAAMPTSGLTSAGIAIGTPAYMAPEQLAGDPAADHRVDLYALGLVAYELLTGESPFQGSSPQATMAAQLTRIPEPLHECCPDVPPSLSAVLMRCLAKNADDRPHDARELQGQLDAISTPQGGIVATGAPWTSGVGAPTPVSGESTVTAVGQRWSRTAFIGLAVTGALFVAGALAWSARNEAREAREISAQASASSAARLSSPPVAASTAPAVTPTLPRVQLTRADSLAIAAAVQQKMRESQRELPAPASAPAQAAVGLAVQVTDSIRIALQHFFTDSIRREIEKAKALAGHPGDAGSRSAGMLAPRVAPVPSVPGSMVFTRTWPSAPAVIPDSLRKVLLFAPSNASGNTQHDAIGIALAERVRAELEQRGLEVRQAIGARPTIVWGDTAREHADRSKSSVVISGHYVVRRDSLVIRLYVVERLRNFIPRSYTSRAVPVGDAIRGLDTLLPSLVVRTEAALAKKNMIGAR